MTTNTAKPASDRQLAFLRSLLEERQPQAIPYFEARLQAEGFTSADVSAKITHLKTLPKIATTTDTRRPATERQVEYVTDLLAKREHTLDADAELADLTFMGASRLIEMLKAAPKASRAFPLGIIPGHYVVPDPDDLGHMLFRRIDTKGLAWIIAGPNQHPCPATDKALPLIAQDPMFAAAHYGQIIGRCGRCHTRLTDDVSRSVGLGPICRGKGDWHV